MTRAGGRTKPRRARAPRRAPPPPAMEPNAFQLFGELLFTFADGLAAGVASRMRAQGQAVPPTSSAVEQLERDRDLFGLEAHFTREQLRDAYRRLSRVHHPDQGGNDRAMQRINAAHERLKGHAAP